MIGVSRQAVSKWETGDAEPEIGKLRRLAEVFGVTVDWLLSDEDTEDEKKAEAEEEAAAFDRVHRQEPAHWIEAVPGVVGKLLRRFGWLFGVYVALVGAALTGIGALARYLAGRLIGTFSGAMPGEMPGFSSGGMIVYDQFGEQVQLGGEVGSTISDFAANNPVTVFGGVMMTVGIILVLAGLVLAVVLRRMGRK